MTVFRYQAIESNGASVEGVIEAEDRRSALQLLGKQGLFPSRLDLCRPGPAPALVPAQVSAPARSHWGGRIRFGSGVKRKEITAFTREIAALIGAGIPIP